MICSLFFILLIVAFLLAGERYFPFSSFGMFAYGYKEQYVVQIGNEEYTQFIPLKKSTGYTTSGLSREIVFCMDDAAHLKKLLDNLSQIMERNNGIPYGMGYVWLLKITVDRSGNCHTSRSLVGKLNP